MLKDTSPYKLLMTRNIYSILDGDTKFEEYRFKDDNSTIEISMPYLSGSQLCDISNLFGFPQTYGWGGGNLSRWQYLENLFYHCIENNRCSDFLSYLFDMSQFKSIFSGHDISCVDTAYRYFVNRIICEINKILYFGKHKLIILNNKFIVEDINISIQIYSPVIKKIDREYVRDISNRAIDDVENENFDSALTKSRTMIEEVFCYVIEAKGIAPSKSGCVNSLYKQVKDLYNMHYENSTDIRIKTLLSGLEKILSSIAEMRNLNSDSHGVGLSELVST